MQKLCIAFYMVLGAVLGIWLSFVQFGFHLHALVGERLFVTVGAACALLVSCLVGCSINSIWRRASDWQRAYLATLGALTIATLIGIAVIVWIYVATQHL
jgi:hypothetical protein